MLTVSKLQNLTIIFCNPQIDTLALGMITALEEATLLRVDSSTSNDYMEMEIVSKMTTTDSRFNNRVENTMFITSFQVTLFVIVNA